MWHNVRSLNRNYFMNNDKQNTKQSEDEVENGFFTDDDNRLQAKEEHEEDAATKPGKDEKVTPLEPSTEPTLGDKITVNPDNEDLVTLVTDDNPDSYDNENEDDEAH